MRIIRPTRPDPPSVHNPITTTVATDFGVLTVQTWPVDGATVRPVNFLLDGRPISPAVAQGYIRAALVSVPPRRP